jgi:phosphatidylglycerophosphate synthase
MISYVKARAEALGGACPVGVMGRAPRIVYLCGWALCLGLGLYSREVLLTGGALYLALTVATVLQRIHYVRSKAFG